MPKHPLLSGLLCLVMLSSARAEQPVVSTDNDFPAHEALRLAFRNTATLLPEDASCQGVVSDSRGGHTLGDWMAWYLSHLDPRDGHSGIEAGCEGPLNALQCHIHAKRNRDLEVWHWGVRFTADGRTGAIDRDSIVCDSAG